MANKKLYVTEKTLTLDNLEEYLGNAVGEASTLFYRNDDHIFDSKAGEKLVKRLVKGVRKLVKNGQ